MRDRTRYSLTRATTLAMACLLLTAPIAVAQQKLGAPPVPARSTTTSPAAPVAASSRAATTPALPAPETMLALIRTHILALDHALRTNNFTVLHALSGPYLQTRLTPHQLAHVFRPLAAERPDLAAAAIRTPALTASPSYTSAGMLWLKGTIPTAAREIRFEMMFEAANSEWRLAGIDVATATIAADTARGPATLKPTLTR